MPIKANFTHLKNKILDRTHQTSVNLHKKLLGKFASPLLFEHIPKCGGTTVNDFLAKQYLTSERFEIDGMNVDSSHEEWRQLGPAQRAPYRLLVGHGAHKLRNLFADDAKRLTILREPVDRIISHFHFARTSPNHYLFEAINQQKLSLAEYAVSDLSPEITNNYIRRFTGISAEESQRAPKDSAEQAFDLLLSEYSVIGFTENLDDAMTAIAEACQFPFADWKPQRRNSNKLRPRDIDHATIEIIRERNAADVFLYEMLKNQTRGRGFASGKQ